MNVETTNLKAFTRKESRIVDRLIIPVDITNGDKKIRVDALWDTGATVSCVSYGVVNALDLVSMGRLPVRTPSGYREMSTYKVDVLLPNNVGITGVEVCDSEIGAQNLGMLIGMNIISLGDFSVSNYNGITTFTFRSPSNGFTDYVQQIRASNITGPKHGQGKRKKH